MPWQRMAFGLRPKCSSKCWIAACRAEVGRSQALEYAYTGEAHLQAADVLPLWALAIALQVSAGTFVSRVAFVAPSQAAAATVDGRQAGAASWLGLFVQAWRALHISRLFSYEEQPCPGWDVWGQSQSLAHVLLVMLCCALVGAAVCCSRWCTGQ